MRRAIVALSLIVFSSIGSSADAKCPFLRYAFKGQLELPVGVDSSRIRIVAFLDDLPTMSAYPPAEEESDYLVPQRSGHFEGVSYFSTASGKTACRGRAEKLTLVVLGDGIRSQRTVVEIEGGESLRDRGGLEIDLGNIPVRQ